MTPPVSRILGAIDLDGLLAALTDLVAIRSETGTSGETAAQEFVAGLMREMGLDVDTWELDFDALRAHSAYSAEFDRAEGLGVVGSMGRGEGPSLILNGHVDVVPAGEPEGWSVEPWQATIRGGRVYGRGALDMKGGLCCALFAAKAVRDAGMELDGRLHIMSVIGEEDGGCGTLAAVQRGYRADGAVVMEPTEVMIAPAQAGALNFRIKVPGRAAHGALRSEGVDPIEKFIPIFQALRDLERRRNDAIDDPRFSTLDLPFALCIGTLNAGIWASTVAERLTAEGRYGIAPGEDLADARRQLEEAVADVAERDAWLRDHPPTVEWWGGQFAPAAIPSDHPLVTTLNGAFEAANGRVPRLQGMPYGADMRLLVNEGDTPTVLFGPGDIRLAHQPDESVPIDDLLAGTRTLALTIGRFTTSGG